MDKNAIKKFAIWARRELIERVSQKAMQYGIEKANIIDAAADSINGTVLTDVQKNQRRALISQINHKGFEEVMEEVAYTWFNRLIALRFMEVNGYLPTRVRVFTDEENNFKPQIIDEALHLDLDGLNIDKVYEFKNANQTEELYKYLLITQCNALNSVLPGMFQRISDFTELLLPDNLLREGSVIEQMISAIPEEDWQDAVQIIGWLYQYYNAEKKDEVFAALKKNVKIKKENIPAVTQLFTPDWIVRYMVENSLGRLWVEGHPNDELKAGWKYYLEEAEQEPEVQAQLAEIRKEYAAMTPEQIKCIDPCCGSGHILAYLFDVLVQIYESYGYTTREAVESIVKNNLYGLDIDDRAAQLAYFAVMMKARRYDRRFFSRQIQPNVYAIRESNDIDKYALDYFCNGDAKLKAAMDSIVKEMQDAKEYGSILNITPVDFAALYARFDEVRDDISISKETVLNDLLPLVRVAEILAQKYDVVVTNPPYMGSGGMGVKLTDFVKKNYPDSKSDMSTVCMEKTLSMCRKNGFMTMINIPVWMFLASYENLRNALLRDNTIINMIHPGRGIFGSDFGTTTFVFRKSNSCGYVGCYHRLFDTQGEVKSNEEREKAFLERKGQYYTDQLNFSKIPGTPVAYWVSDTLMEAFAKGIFVGDICEPRVGMATANNDRFIRLWYEVSMNKIGLGMKNREEAVSSKKKWFPFSKGGEFRKWYGNNDYVVNWENDGIEIRNFKDEKTGRIRSHNYNLDYIFQSAITWTVISSATTSFRFCPEGFLYSNSGYGMFFLHKSDIPVTLGFLNTSVVMSILSVLSPTIGFESGYLRKIPYLSTPDEVTAVVNECVSISKADWDDFESSWDFKNHPLIRLKDSMKLTATDGDSKMVSYFLQGIYHAWENECEERFNQLKANEEELNRIFIDIYGLQDELTPEVEDKDVTVRKADLQRDIRSLISYAVGCMSC